MSDAYQTDLLANGETAYGPFATGVTVVALATFVLAAATLFGWVPIGSTVGPASVATYFGAGLLVLGLGTGGLGAFSRWGRAETTPDRSAGLAVGVVQTLLWSVAAGLVASHTVGLGSLGWLVALPVGALAGYLAIATREDVGATVPAAAFLGVCGAVVLAGVVAPDWAWRPAAFDATIPGTVVIPLLAVVGSLLAAWAGASAREGFGTRGRQHGAFLLISVVVSLVLSVLVFLLVFVFERGIAVVVENLTVGAGSGVVLCAAVLVVLGTHGDLRPTVSDGTDAVVGFVQLSGAVALGLAGAGLCVAILRGQPVTGYAVTIAPTVGIGAVPGFLAGLVLLSALRSASSDWTPATAPGRRIGLAVKIAGLSLAGALLVELATGGEFALLGIAVVPTLALGVGAGAAALVVAAEAGERVDPLAVPTWLPPGGRGGVVALWAFLTVCLHVAITGLPFALGPVGAITTGTIDWPFVMNPSQGLGIQKGVMPAMLGTIWIVLGAVTFAVPLAVGAAVFLTEYAEDSVFTRAVDVATNGLWSTPSIVFGLFGLAFLVPRFGGSPSIFAAQLVLGFMLLPLVLITSREAMKSVPDEYRDASAALGVSKWDTIRSVVIPAAMPGVVTGVILGVGRIAGETAPLLLVLNGPNFPNAAPGVLSSFSVRLGAAPPFVHVSNPALLDRASALPYQLYAIITAGVGAEESFGWGTTLVLLGVVLAFFATSIATRRYFRRKLHQ